MEYDTPTRNSQVGGNCEPWLAIGVCPVDDTPCDPATYAPGKKMSGVQGFHLNPLDLVYKAARIVYSECLPTLLNPVAERTIRLSPGTR